MRQKQSIELINVKAQANTVYRIALPENASTRQRRKFEREIQIIQQINPHWSVIPDWPQQGEDEVFIILKKDKDYHRRRMAYLATASVSRSLQGVYGG